MSKYNFKSLEVGYLHPDNSNIIYFNVDLTNSNGWHWKSYRTGPISTMVELKDFEHLSQSELEYAFSSLVDRELLEQQKKHDHDDTNQDKSDEESGQV